MVIELVVFLVTLSPEGTEGLFPAGGDGLAEAAMKAPDGELETAMKAVPTTAMVLD